MIHVAYRLWGGDGFYAKMCGTSMVSMFENTREKVTVHIMHNERLTPDNRGKFCYIAGLYNQRVEFHNVEEIAGATLRKFEAAHPIKSGINAAWYPLIVHEVFPNLDKLIFLGTDTVIHLDIGELWEINVTEEEGFGAITDHLVVPRKLAEKKYNFTSMIDNYVKYEDHFCADVFLMRPQFFRENFDTILEGCKFVYEKPGWHACEQAALNYLFSSKYKKLPLKFNVAVYWARQLSEYSGVPPRIERAIYHFGGLKPSLNVNDVFNGLYLEYFLKTPWANVEMFGNLDREFKRQYDFLKDQFLHYTNLLSERGRIFIVDKNNEATMRQAFRIKDDEWVVDVNNAETMKHFYEVVEGFKGRKIIYVLSNIGVIRRELRARKFVEGYDFFDAKITLKAEQGGILNYDSHKIVREM